MEQLQVGIDIGGTKMLLLAQTKEGQKSRKIATGTNFSATDAEIAINSFLKELPTPPSSIGIAIPGLVAPTGEVVYCDVLPKLDGWLPSVKKDAACPVCVLNDSNAALIEAMEEIGSASHVALAIVGTAIGSSFWVDGRFLQGTKGWAGELGSIPIQISEGSKILDNLAGGAAILQNLGVDAQQLVTLVEQEDKIALDAIAQAGRFLGLGIATVINLFNPEVVVLAGGTLRWRGYLEAAISSAKTHSVPAVWASCRIHPSIHGGEIVALGVARAASQLIR